MFYDKREARAAEIPRAVCRPGAAILVSILVPVFWFGGDWIVLALRHVFHH